MNTHVTDSRPFHQRMEASAMKHLIAVLKHLCGGSIGFDPCRDARTATKEAIVSFIAAGYSSEQIDLAHAAVCATYPKLPGRGRRGRRSNHGVNPALLAPYAGEGETYIPEAPVSPTLPSAEAASELASILTRIAASSVTEERVASIVAAKVASLTADFEARIAAAVAAADRGAVTVEIKVHDLPPVKTGIQHRKFPLLLKTVNTRMHDGTRVNAWLAGPAGVSKTHSCKAIASAFGLPFAFTGPVDQPYALIGYRNATGELVRTPFMDCWENGGVFLWDEITASSNPALMAFQGALANGVCPFPHGMIERHRDCIIICADNTFGTAASTEYVGTNKLNAAFLDRFAKIKWDLDPALEAALSTNDGWLSRVRHVRDRVQNAGIKHLVTPRATLIGQALLANGIAQSDVEEMVLKGALSNDQWSKVL